MEDEHAGAARDHQRADGGAGEAPSPGAAPLAQATTRYQDLSIARRLRGNRASLGAATLRGGVATPDTGPLSPTGGRDGTPGTREDGPRHRRGRGLRRLTLTVLVLVILTAGGAAAAWWLGALPAEWTARWPAEWPDAWSDAWPAELPFG